MASATSPRPSTMAVSPLLAGSPTYQMACDQLIRRRGRHGHRSGHHRPAGDPQAVTGRGHPDPHGHGEVRTFVGYRVQHSLTSGASKGGLRYAPHVDLGEVAALSMWMSWKVGIMNLPFSGAKGGIACDPTKMSRGELERLTRRYTEEVLPIIGPRIDVMAPDMGTDEQTMAWIMDTYSMKVGYACPEIVTGKPVELGGCVGRREATGRGVVYCILEAMNELNIKPEESTAVVQGFGNVGSVVCQELDQRGVKIIAIGDRYGAIRNTEGHRHPGPDAARGRRASWLKDFPGAELDPGRGVADHARARSWPRAPWSGSSPARTPRELKCRILAEGANGPTTPEADRILTAVRHLRHPGHPVQRRRRDGQLLRVGAGPAAVLLGRRAGERQAAGADAEGLPPRAGPGEGAESVEPHGRPEPRGEQGGPGEGETGAVSVERLHGSKPSPWALMRSPWAPEPEGDDKAPAELETEVPVGSDVRNPAIQPTPSPPTRPGRRWPRSCASSGRASRGRR